METPPPGSIVLLGSGETAPSVQPIYHRFFQTLGAQPDVAVLETPAGFQPNAQAIAQDIARFIRQRLPNHRPQVRAIPARRRDGAWSTNDPRLLAPLFEANVILTGPGSPTYAVAHLKDSVCWDYARSSHRLGRHLFLSSAATVAIGRFCLPVYEIYKVGQDPFWSAGLDLLGDFGLSLAVIPHWNNKSGGDDFDTRRCYMGTERFERLLALLPADAAPTVLGIDENTGVRISLAEGLCEVLGRGSATILRAGAETCHAAGAQFSLDALGDWFLPRPDAGIAPARWREFQARVEQAAHARASEPEPPAQVQDWLRQRLEARAAKDWRRSDELRARIQANGWIVQDTPQGQKVAPAPSAA